MTLEVDENGDGAIDWEEFQLMYAVRRIQPSKVCTSQARALACRHFSAIPTTQPGHTHATPTCCTTHAAPTHAAHIEYEECNRDVNICNARVLYSRAALHTLA